MIRLKQLLFEQPDYDKPKILFIGDKQTLARTSYASNLINSGAVTGITAGKPKADAADLYKTLRNKLNDTYEVVVITTGPDQIIDRNHKTINTSVRVLDGCIRLAKTKGAKVIVVSLPLTNTKSKLTTSEIDSVLNSIQTNKDADDIISINITKNDINSKTGVLIANIQTQIQTAVINSINNLINADIQAPDIESDESETEEPSYSLLSKIPANAAEFINMWKSVAIDNMNQYGIPASITLAQAGLESGWGTSRLSLEGNNYFGIKCHGWSGEKIYANDDHPNECFRKYKDAGQSFNDHSVFLKNNGRYSSLFKLDKTDFEGWANGLQSAGYATSQTYATKLIKIIKSYGLNKYDTGSGGTVNNDISTDAAAAQVLKLPFNYKDISSSSTYRRKDEKLKSNDYFIVHHTAGRGTPSGVVNTLNKRGLGVQWVVDREGNIYQTLPQNARGAHILQSKLGPSNSNSQGVEVIAKNDSDVLPVQAAAVLKLVKALGYSPSQIYGHGEVNPGHKQATEGQTIKQYILKNYSK